MRPRFTAFVAMTVASAWVALAAGACKQTGGTAASAPPPDGGSGAAPASGTEDDRPDQAAPVAGAYLSCLVAKPQEKDDSLTAGCQVRDKDKNKIDLKTKYPGYTWTVVPPPGKDGKPSTAPSKIEVFDLAAQKDKNYYFQVAMRMKLDAPAAGVKGAGLTNTTVETKRKQNAEFFLALKPLMVVAPKKTGAGLALADGKSENSGRGKAKSAVQKEEDDGATLVDTPNAVGSKRTFGQLTAAVLAATQASRDFMSRAVVKHSTESPQNFVTESVIDPTAGTQPSADAPIVIDEAPPTVTAQPVQDVATLVPDAAAVQQIETTDTVTEAETSGSVSTDESWTESLDSPGGTVSEESGSGSGSGSEAASGSDAPLDKAACDALYEKRNDDGFDQKDFETKCPDYIPS